MAMSEEPRVSSAVTQDGAQQGQDGLQQPGGTATPAPLPQHVVKRTRMGGLWLASGSFAVVLLLLLIFILENSKSVDVAYFGAHGHLPLGVALLLAAVLGILMVVIPGSARIVQLRMTARRHRRADAKRAAVAQQPPAPPAAGQTAAPGPR
jgi:lipopolysaccharide assembly protein A